MNIKNKFNKKGLRYFLLAALIAIAGLSSIYLRLTFLATPKEADKIEGSSALLSSQEPKKETVVLKENAYIEIPYTVQAPNSRWDVHEESCEEAAALMYHYFLIGNKEKNISPETANKDMLKMISWQKKNYGSEPDLKITAFGNFMNSYYGYSHKIIDATKENIMKSISAGKPVIVPVMTHALKNPHYGPRDSYHLLLIKGYDKSGVITNDAGVSQGRNFRYTWETLFLAIDAQTPVLKQGRIAIYLTKDQ